MVKYELTKPQIRFLKTVLAELDNWINNRANNMFYRTHLRNAIDNGYYTERERLIISNIREMYIQKLSNEKK